MASLPTPVSRTFINWLIISVLDMAEKVKANEIPNLPFHCW